MSRADPPIVISGGSITIEFDQSNFKPDPSNGNKHSNKDKQIKRIEITGDGINIAETVTNGLVTIKIYYGNP